jgi:thioredoxin reductase (NADPH)
VQYYVRRREDLRGKRVVIAGGGDSAVDWALALKDLAAVAVVHRRPKFRAAPESAARLDEAARHAQVEMVIPYQLHALHGAAGRLTGVEVATLAGETRILPADVLLPFFGLSMDLGPIAGWALDLERHHVKVDPATGQTSLPGVFAIGDVATYPGKLKLILQGFSEAAVAAHAIHPIVHPGEALHFEYSTTKGVQALSA